MTSESLLLYVFCLSRQVEEALFFLVDPEWDGDS